MTENSKKMVKEERKDPKNQKKIREHFVFSNMLRLFLAGILYCILMMVSNVRIPCIFYKITGGTMSRLRHVESNFSAYAWKMETDFLL